ncbi:MAG: hypothetical protein ACO39F_07405, partial [Candidatus Nanopelagicaceae bacterium]
WAESELLAAYALFYMCKFPAARERIETFEQRWKPVLEELASLDHPLSDLGDDDLLDRCSLIE